ncbi:MAG TPA: glycosyltransferase family 4 protein [Sedimentisphaerales bacterium]|nr:glycosyltransferase family 4 protein [Sedimentisphaerales bacterium]
MIDMQGNVVFVSSFVPRKCGIATFTSDLVNGVGISASDGFRPTVVAMQSGPELRYDKPVRFRIRKEMEHDYIHAADYVNFSSADVVCLQHEFGLFGGAAGAYINLFLERVNKPVITTLHTVLENAPSEYFRSLSDVCQASECVVVMNKRGIKMLRDIYGVPAGKIKLIPHGIPDLPFSVGDYHKQKLGIGRRKVILTFGLLSRHKGIEVMLRALPSIVKADPSVLYIVLGATHPEVLRREGQRYKFKLEKIVAQLKLAENVVFHNRFVDKRELFEFLIAADVYVTPYLNKEQLTSGTLAFAVGAGKAVVSTPYWAAEELLAEGRGKLVHFGDSEELAGTILEIFNDETLFFSMKTRAYSYGRSMIWQKVGQAYRKLFTAQKPALVISSSAQPDIYNCKTRCMSRFALPYRKLLQDADPLQIHRSA